MLCFLAIGYLRCDAGSHMLPCLSCYPVLYELVLCVERKKEKGVLSANFW